MIVCTGVCPLTPTRRKLAVTVAAEIGSSERDTIIVTLFARPARFGSSEKMPRYGGADCSAEATGPV